MVIKKYGRRAVALLLGAIMLFALAACGGNEPIEEESSSVPSSSSAPTSSSEVAPAKISDDTAKKLDEAKVTNPETVSWLYIPNTNIDYPVLYNADDNFKYETKDVNGQKSTLDTSKLDADVKKNLGNTKAYIGAIYFDARSTTPGSSKPSRNLPIYGHNWTNIVEPYRIGNAKDYDVMFAQLMSYTDEKFAKENPYIYLSTGEETKVYKVFSAVYFNAYCLNYGTPDLKDEDFKKLLDDAQARSVIKFDTEVSTSDNIINLITCCRKYPKSKTQITAGGSTFNIQRFAVLARELRPGETDKDPVNVSKNTGNIDPTWTTKNFYL